MRLTLIGIALFVGSFVVGVLGVMAPPLLFIAALMALGGVVCIFIGIVGGVGGAARKSIKRASGDRRGTGQL